ncbi:ATP synthase gamma chain [hydrothermal vent metagenome]|uniref:ATP synthase gamma chain n=1 Tax=hydrothermal vent metagenome TaxID=652676 RepID=A0A3B1CUI3_9ZZZZ
MATLRDIKRRITSIKSTSKITRAMKMVSASKLRRAQERMFALRPYSDKMREVLLSLAQPGEQDRHPLLKIRPRKTVEVLILTSDKGLCGAFNTNVLKAGVSLVKDLENEGFETSISTLGRKAGDYFKRRNIPVRQAWTGLSGKISYTSAQEIAVVLMDKYINETFDELYLIYNEFKSVASQKVTKLRLLPLGEVEHEEEDEMKDFLFEPSEAEIFNRLLPKSVEIQLYRTMLESRVSEEAARMTAMENATQSAEDMIDRLTLEYNKARQATITRELMDIVGGAEAIND